MNTATIGQVGSALGTYSYNFRCANCGQTHVLHIKRGIPVSEFFPGPCVNCGCDSLKRFGIADGLIPKDPTLAAQTARCKCITPDAHQHNYATPHPTPYR